MIAVDRFPDSPPDPGSTFPLVLTPPERGDPLDALSARRDLLLELALDYGAILFRNFPVRSPEDFAAVVESLRLENMPYIGGAAVRSRVSGERVFTANEAPPSEPIPFHHEMAQVPDPPAYILFYADLPAADGGETPILRSNEVYDYFAETFPGFCRRVEELGVRYRRVMPEEDDPGSAIGRGWKSTFQVESRGEAERCMREMGSTWEWLAGGDLLTLTRAVPAVRRDARNGKKVFFSAMVAAYTGWVDARNDPVRAVQLGDGSAVDGPALLDLDRFMKTRCTARPWRRGDVLFIDNGLVMHARNPFTPPRRILASVARAALA